ncbi:MAG: hypothetical protein GQ526_12450, partial [Ardenticatenales bacterium]|nr:hypothetical protein [Ardenticatenales bacterium]
MVGTTGGIERFARRLAGRPVDRALKEHVETVEAVNALEPALRSTSETKLRERAGLLMRRARSGTHLDDMLVALFALVRE